MHAMTQTNIQTGKARNIKCRDTQCQKKKESGSTLEGTNDLKNIACKASKVIHHDSSLASDTWRVEVWLAGEWKRLGAAESAEISQRQAEKTFEITSRGMKYKIDL